jgi:hypothetical protein
MILSPRFLELLYVDSPETDQLRNSVSDTTFCPVNLNPFEGAAKELPSVSYTLHIAEDPYMDGNPRE